VADINKRKKVESYILTLMKKIDPSKYNFGMYSKLFEGMNDKEFDSYMVSLREKETSLFMISPNMKPRLKMNEIVELAKEYGVELFQRIFLIDPNTKRKYLTNKKYMILDLPVRRVKQYLFGKLSLPESDSHINALTGQVIPPDKGSALANIEVQILASKNLDKSLLEMVKVRGGDTKAYSQFKHQLEEEGRTSLAETPMDSRPRSVITTGIYLNAMMFEHNLSG